MVKDSLTTPPRPSATPPPAEEGETLEPAPRLGLRSNLIRNLDTCGHLQVGARLRQECHVDAIALRIAGLEVPLE